LPAYLAARPDGAGENIMLVLLAGHGAQLTRPVVYIPSRLERSA
jgi:hypothetical protein